MDADSFLVYVKIYIYKDIAKDVEKRFETSNYGSNRPFPKGESRKVIRWRYNYLKDNNNKEKKQRRMKKRKKRKLKCQDYKNCLEAVEIKNEINHLILTNIKNITKT